MKKVDFNKLQAGDLVEVPRTQFAPMRSGWNGWLFSEAVVIRKGVGRKSKKNVVVVEMRTPAGKNSYGTIEATFYAENVFTTPAAKNARNMGAKSDRTAYKPYGRRQKIGIYCTKAQKIEIELEFEFYRNVFYEELSTFMDAFIQAQKIFPEDAPVGDYDEFNERDMKIAFMATGIERRSRAAMIEESEAGNEKTKTTGS